MFLERQRGITIQAAVTSFQWHRCKVNIVDTPGHMNFLAQVYRSLAILDGAILVISDKAGVQAQTRILFHALRKMNIPTVIFINKIDQAGVDLQSVVQSVRDKLSACLLYTSKRRLPFDKSHCLYQAKHGFHPYERSPRSLCPQALQMCIRDSFKTPHCRHNINNRLCR